MYQGEDVLGEDGLLLPTLGNAGVGLMEIAQMGAIPKSLLGMGAMVKAYHGTPHKVDKFRMDKIGTGEGEQAYGHGLYFAENPDVARQYKETLTRISPDSDSRVVLRVDGKEIDTMSLPDDPINKRLNDYINAWDDDLNLSSKDIDIDDVLDDVAFDMKQELSNRWSTDEDKSFAESILKRIDEMRGKDITLGIDDTGNLYNVDIDVNHEDLLDWDAPLSEQPEILKKLRKLSDDPNTPLTGDFAGQLRDSLQSFELNNTRGETVVHLLGGDAEASRVLREAGIPGIRYLDAGSRGSKEGTRNLVMFDEDLIKIADDTKGLNVISDVFGDGNLVKLDDGKGNVAVKAIMPNKKQKWHIESQSGDIISKGGIHWHNSYDEAIKSVKGEKISRAAKIRNAKYEVIPSLWGNEEKQLAKRMIDKGVQIGGFNSSTQSNSVYITLTNGDKIRISDHKLPLHYESADYEFIKGGDIDNFVSKIAKDK
jgi:hypothetical protein